MDEALSTSHPPQAVNGLSSPKLLQYLVAGVIGCAAIAAGIYLGFSSAMESASGKRLLHSLNHSYLDIGDPVPDYELWDAESQRKTSVKQLTEGRPALLLFVSTSCGACHSMSDYWATKVVPLLSKDIVWLTIYDAGDWNGDSASAVEDRLFPMATVMTADRDEQEKKDGITSTPTLVAVKADGQIALIATGFSREVSGEFLNGLW